MPKEELEVLEKLDALFGNQKVRSRIDKIVERVRTDLASHPEKDMAWEPIPLAYYSGGLPPGIKSSWVFILRKDTVTGAERHPNSHQRMMAYSGDGDFQTRLDGPWQSNFLQSRPEVSVEERWISIPPFVWHQSAAPAQDWVVVSFHTVEAEDLIEERPLDPEGSEIAQMKYLDSH